MRLILGGLLYSLMEHVPEQGECVEHQGWRFTVLSFKGGALNKCVPSVSIFDRDEELAMDGRPEQRPFIRA